MFSSLVELLEESDRLAKLESLEFQKLLTETVKYNTNPHIIELRKILEEVNKKPSIVKSAI